jgi:hypothetical protein
VGSFTQGTLPLTSPYSPVSDRSAAQQSARPSPSAGPFGSDGIAAQGRDPWAFALPMFLSHTPRSDSWHRLGWNFASASIHTYHPMVTTYRMDDTRPPWVTHASSPPCRPHTPWYDEEEPKRLRHHSAGSTIPRLWPTGSSVGWLPSMTTRWFSASPSDPPSREAPCPPENSTRWLQVPLGCLLLSRSCPYRVLHTCLVLWPVRHDPHLGISTRGLGSSGTSTRLRRVLPGTRGYLDLSFPGL